MTLPGPESRAFQRMAMRSPDPKEDNFWATGKKYAPQFWEDVRQALDDRAMRAIRTWDDQSVGTYWRVLALGDAFGYWSAANIAAIAPTLAEFGPDNWASAVATALPMSKGKVARKVMGWITRSPLGRTALDAWYHPASRLVRLAARAADQYEPATSPASTPAEVPGLRPKFDFKVRRLPGEVALGPGGRKEFPGLEITARPRPRPNPIRRLDRPGRTPLAAPQRFDFTTRELPGSIRTRPGGGMQFPGVEITARPRPNLLRDLGRHLEAAPPFRPPASAATTTPRFDWTVRQLPGEVRPGPRGRLSFPGVEITARPRPNLLQELGQQLGGSAAGRSPRYDFTIRQAPGNIRPRPGGGMQFPPMEVIARPVASRPNLLRDLGDRLQRLRP